MFTSWTRRMGVLLVWAMVWAMVPGVAAAEDVVEETMVVAIVGTLVWDLPHDWRFATVYCHDLEGGAPCASTIRGTDTTTPSGSLGPDKLGFLGREGCFSRTQGVNGAGRFTVSEPGQPQLRLDVTNFGWTRAEGDLYTTEVVVLQGNWRNPATGEQGLITGAVHVYGSCINNFANGFLEFRD